MKEKVIVNGFELSREQIEKALEELNEPEPPQLPTLTQVRGRGIASFIKAVVINGGPVPTKCRDTVLGSEYPVMIVCKDGSFDTYKTVEDCLRLWEPI